MRNGDTLERLLLNNFLCEYTICKKLILIRTRAFETYYQNYIQYASGISSGILFWSVFTSDKFDLYSII